MRRRFSMTLLACRTRWRRRAGVRAGSWRRKRRPTPPQSIREFSGCSRIPAEPQINYRERPPLVVPPRTDCRRRTGANTRLRPPTGRRTPRLSEARRKHDRLPSTTAREQTGRALTPKEIAGPHRRAVKCTPATAAGDENPGREKPDELGPRASSAIS